VVAATGAPRLVVPVPASDHSMIVAVYATGTPELEKCAGRVNPDRHLSNAEEENTDLERFERLCVAEVQLRVDGRVQRQQHDFYFGEQQVLLEPGEARELTVDVVKNDPRNVRYALVIWVAR
jgi:hypothetical protein